MEAMFLGDNHFSKIKSLSEANATKHLIILENVPIMDDIATLKKMIKHIHIQIAPQLVSKSSGTSKHGDNMFYKALLDVI